VNAGTEKLLPSVPAFIAHSLHNGRASASVAEASARRSFGREAEPLCDATAVVLVALREVGGHALLYVSVALADEIDEVVDQLYIPSPFQVNSNYQFGFDHRADGAGVLRRAGCRRSLPAKRDAPCERGARALAFFVETRLELRPS
jgi:hypothetical protein